MTTTTVPGDDEHASSSRPDTETETEDEREVDMYRKPNPNSGANPKRDHHRRLQVVTYSQGPLASLLRLAVCPAAAIALSNHIVWISMQACR